MKKIKFLLGLFLLITSFGVVKGQEAVQNGPEISFVQTTYDFGKIPFKGDASFEFVFENTGNEPLILQKPKPSCSCTVPEWPESPINRGEKSSIKVTYKKTNQPGIFSQRITVFSNALKNNQIVLTIKGEVLKENTMPLKENNGPVNN